MQPATERAEKVEECSTHTVSEDQMDLGEHAPRDAYSDVIPGEEDGDQERHDEDRDGPENEWVNTSGSLADEEEEQRVLFGAVDSFSRYQRHMHYNITHLRRQALYALPEDHLAILTAPPFSYLDTLIAVDDAIDANAVMAKSILSGALSSFSLPTEFPKRDPSASADASHHKQALDWRGTATANDMDKAQTIIRQMYRDWSSEGAIERDASNGVALRDLDTYFPADNPRIDRNRIKVLVPGAGLGRLMFDVCKAGFEVEGNEISYHALLASSYILNHIPAGRQHSLYPWATHFSNRVSREDQLRCVKIPDVHPGTVLGAASQGQRVHAFDRMSMSASDFTLLYSDDDHREIYDAVCTVFFIDTAPNVMRYIETIRNCLKPDGLWINVGPLLWHFNPGNPNHFQRARNGRARSSDTEDHSHGHGHAQEETIPSGTRGKGLGIAEPGSIELTNEEVLLLVQRSGFRIETEEIIGESSSSSAASTSTAHSTSPPSSSGTCSTASTPSEERRAADGLAGYIHDRTSLFQQVFRLAHWVARKNPQSHGQA